MLKKLGFQRVTSVFALLFTLFCIPLTSFAGGYVELPRTFGTLEMGMSAKDFTKLTGVRPEFCAICIKKESFVTLSRGQLYSLDAEGEGADVFFFENKLYLISVSTMDKDFTTINEDFENEFGGPGKKLKPLNDVAKLKWEDTNSVIMLNYHKTDKRVFSVNYYDWDIKQERDWRETQALELEKKQAKTLVMD